MISKPFSYSETHGLAYRPGTSLHYSSEAAGWPHLFASVQTEAPFKDFLPAVKDHLLVVTLDRPIQVTWRIGGATIQAVRPPGNISLTPGGTAWELEMQAAGEFDSIHLYLRRELLEEIQMEMLGEATGGLQYCVSFNDPMISAIAGEVRSLLVRNEPLDAFYAETLARTLSYRLVKTQSGKASERRVVPPPSSPRQFSKAVDYIKQNLEQNITLADIGGVADATTGQLIRQFKSHARCTPYEYVLRLRVEKARRLLVFTNVPLSEVAIGCGFSDQQHMTRIVHRVLGATPGKIRRQRAS